ncbi:PREDICTED: C-type lectin domain family 12 member A-like [Dipodomys ordii]|uniref:C-type lectin domain family 12 member A-like n=1 Tax=Dipodomys ordii TaxID=10020 RepID=A0A1S3FWR5_DIPOR|nr:PREDICTED: C-type lectin domain family 12 member A-like [Dipodomys ordii]
MSEEVTYADLNFQNSGKTQKIQELDPVETKEPPAPSHVWTKIALGLTFLLFLLLLLGLGILGSVIYKLQNAQEDLQRNVSLQQMGNVNSSEKIQNLSIALQTMATRLCRELQKKEQGHKCKPCPQDWEWHANRCYRLSSVPDTWENSQKSCAHHNASLLKINNKDAQDFVKSLRNNYWLGASPRQSSSYYDVKVDDSIMSNIWSKSNLTDLNKAYCGYLNRKYIYYYPCSEQKYAICEKMSGPVRVESVLG